MAYTAKHGMAEVLLPCAFSALHWSAFPVSQNMTLAARFYWIYLPIGGIWGRAAFEWVSASK